MRKKLYQYVLVNTLVLCCCALSSDVLASPGFSFCYSDTVPAHQEKAVQSNSDTSKVVVLHLQAEKKDKIISDTLLPDNFRKLPFSSLQQFLKGNVPGLYVQENSGEPGVLQNMFIRGLSSPLFQNKDAASVQPAIYLDGIPLIQDNPYLYNLKESDVNPIGTATNLLSFISPENIENIQVIKDPYQLARLGPLASNGAIWIETKQAKPAGMDIGINSYLGFAQSTGVDPVNAAYMKSFLQPFYDKYATAADYASYPSYLIDSTNVNYYGPANWTDLYYKRTPVYHADFNLTTGSNKSNFRFFGGVTQDAGAADKTALKKYNAAIQINVIPYSWLHISSAISGERLDRDRNRNLRDRVAEMGYMPDLTTPLAPNKIAYQSYLDEFSNVMDDNINTLVHGYFSAQLDLRKFSFITRASFDYNEATRDVFWPSDLMQNINYVSDFYDYNQRADWTNTLDYDYNKPGNFSLHIDVGSASQYDMQRYNYGVGYDGPSNFIKVNSGSYLASRFTDEERARLFSFIGNIRFDYRDVLGISLMGRYDGSSLYPANERWLATPAVSVDWNLHNQFLKSSTVVNDLTLRASWARIGKLLSDDSYAAGPQYVSNIGWPQVPTMPSYNGMAGLSRPYTTGWVGYGITWPYTDEFNLNLSGSFFKNRLNASLSLYNKEDKNQLQSIPEPLELGYSGNIANGMSVRNKGIELNLGVNVLNAPDNGLQWNTSLNAAINQNRLTALPGGLNEIVVGDRLLKVGQSVDRFWLLENQGIYNNGADVPVNSATGAAMTYHGITLQAGDPKWKDVNGDYNIDDNDKVLMGHSTPTFFGGWNNQFSYHHFDLEFNFIFALGLNAMNNWESSRYDFVNQASSNSVNSIWEEFFWQKQKSDAPGRYPLYNPWSQVDAYQVNQNIFLENASYLKMRSATLGYEFARERKTNGKHSGKWYHSLYVYASVTNLFTITKFQGGDPELADIDGYYRGYNMPLPHEYILGFRLKL